MKPETFREVFIRSLPALPDLWRYCTELEECTKEAWSHLFRDVDEDDLCVACDELATGRIIVRDYERERLAQILLTRCRELAQLRKRREKVTAERIARSAIIEGRSLGMSELKIAQAAKLEMERRGIDPSLSDVFRRD